MDRQLVDRLIVAAEEQDVLYVLHWLQKMKEENCLEEVINNKHSWKCSSALESILKSPLTQLRRLILEILLLEGAGTQMEAATDLACNNGNEEALQMLMNWEESGKQAAQDSRRLLSISLEEAADWIDTNLEAPPNASSLTGCGDPPPRPAPSSFLPTVSNNTSTSQLESTPKPPSNSPELLSQRNSPTPRSRSPSPDYRFSRLNPPDSQPPGIPSSPCVDPRSRFSDRFRSITPTTFPIPQYSPPPRHPPESSSHLLTPPISRETSISASSTEPNQLTTSTSTTRLHLSFLPVGFSPVDLKALFEDIKVDCQVAVCHTTYLPTYSFVEVPRDQALAVVGALHGKDVRGLKIVCKLDRSMSQHLSRSDSRFAAATSQGSLPRTFSIPFDAPRGPRSSLPTPIAQQTQQTSHLLFLNLPLKTSLEVLAFLANLPRYEFLSLPKQHQSIAFVRVDSNTATDQLINLWNGFEVDGRKIQVVRSKKGTSALEAANYHFDPSILPLKPRDGNSVSPVKSPMKRCRDWESMESKEDWDEGEEKERKRIRS